MADAKPQKLKKEISLLGVYAIATGTTLSAGFFLLPGLAAVEAGPALVLAYLLAAVPLIPAMFSIVELCTAMPRAGGVYFFLDRTLGPLAGTIGGIGTWLSLVLKVSFALIGMGAYISLFLPQTIFSEGALLGPETIFAGKLPVVPIAVFFAIALGVLNIFGAKKSGSFQVFLVIGLLFILTGFIFFGIPTVQTAHFANLFAPGADKIISTAGFVYISYVGVTKVASLSEEVKDPERNLPLGVFLAMGTAILIYALGTFIMVGVIPIDELKGSMTPVADAAKYIFPSHSSLAVVVVSIAALLAFISVANAGIMSASRYPLAMSRDHMVPRLFRRLGAQGTPLPAILLTVGTILFILLALDPTKIAKLASAFQLLMFALVCLGVIVMRESKIDSYDPGFRSPLYPWMQIFGIISSLWLIAGMGALPLIFTGGLTVLGSIWYWFYVRDKVSRNGAIYHLFERLGRSRYEGLDRELRGILKEKGLREDDPFVATVLASHVVDFQGEGDFDAVTEKAAAHLAQSLPYTEKEIAEKFLEGTRIGATPVTHGIALPHFRASGIERSVMVLVRAKAGISISFQNALSGDQEETQRVHSLFFLVSPEHDPALHLRILARIAGRVDEDSFAHEWARAEGEQAMKNSLLHADHYLSLPIRAEGKSSAWVGATLAKIIIPKDCLVAIVRRGDSTFTPNGDTIFAAGDLLTIIGETGGLKEISEQYLDPPAKP